MVLKDIHMKAWRRRRGEIHRSLTIPSPYIFCVCFQDVSAGSVETEEAPDVVLSPGQSLVLRCSLANLNYKLMPHWSKDGQTLKRDGAAPCDSQGVC